ncbi:hypothetical protein EI94DRAFT_1696144 [Lactarius quietus]|nr:hypothetical protein EI94DRAFT_1696144 [Lactarius quietus]
MHTVANENIAPFQGSTHMGTSMHSSTASNCNMGLPNTPVPASSSTTSMASKTQSRGGKRTQTTSQETEIVAQPDYDGNVIKGKHVQHTSLFYPSCSDMNHILAHLEQENDNVHKPCINDLNAKYDGDWNNDEQGFKLALKNPSRFSNVTATERPTWLSGEVEESTATPLTLTSGLYDVDTHANLSAHAPMVSTPVPTTMAVSVTPEAELSEFRADWSTSPVPPNDTLMKSEAASVSVTLTLRTNADLVFLDGDQSSMLWFKMQIDQLRASLLVQNTFPDAVVAFTFAKDALHVAAERCDKPGAALVQSQLQDNDDYVVELVSLISLIHSKVKDCCTAVSAAAILGIGLAPEVARVIGGQLSNYTYTFPRVPLWDHVICFTIWPYVPSPLQQQWEPKSGSSYSHGRLVATTLYAMLYEWCTDEQQAHEFSANAYMDINIYAQASATPSTPYVAAPIAELDLNTLDK